MSSSATSVGTALGGGNDGSHHKKSNMTVHHQRAASDDLARIMRLSDDSQKSGIAGGAGAATGSEPIGYTSINNNNSHQRGQYPPSQIVYSNTVPMSPSSRKNNESIHNIGTTSGNNGHHPQQHQHQQQQQQQYLPFPGPVPGFPYPPSQYQLHHHQPSKDYRLSIGGSTPYSTNNGMVPPGLNGYPPFQTLTVPGTSSLAYSPSGVYGHDPVVMSSMSNFPLFQPSLPASPRDVAKVRTASARNLVGGGTGGNSGNSNKRKDYPGHRRVHSYNGNPSYGSTADNSGGQTTISGGIGAPPLPASRRGGAGQQQQNPSSVKTADFSPVAEFRKLALSAGGGSSTSNSSPRISPVIPQPSPRRRSPPPLQLSPRVAPRRGVSPLNRAMSEDYRFSHNNNTNGTTATNLRPVLSTPGHSDFGSIQQPQQQHGYHQQHHHRQSIPKFTIDESSDMDEDEDNTDDDTASSYENGQQNKNMATINGSFRGGEAAFSVRQQMGMTVYNNGSERGGEATFLLPNNSKKTKETRGKSGPGGGGGRRAMMMRQKSAQNFMESIKGTEQIPACRDLIFLLLFVFHLLGIVYLGDTYGLGLLRTPINIEDDGTTTSEASISVDVRYLNLIYLAGLSGIFAVTISAVILFLMMVLAKNIVQIALAITITFSFVWGTMGIGLSPKMVVPATGFIALALSVGYAFIVWDRIPFVASNLAAGLTGIRANPGVLIIAFFFQFLAFGWSIYYTFVVVGLYDAVQNGDIGDSYPWMKSGVYFLLGVSYYWTLQVFLNIVQVTVAGVIGSWWYKPEDDFETRGADLNQAFFRSCFYALGSICFGSLFVGPVKILRQLSVFFRPSDEVSSLLCLHECLHCIQTCLTSIVESLADRFSSWSFAYVGLYGYGFIDAGLLSAALFEKRGWSTIVSDDLVPNVLLLSSLVIGGTTGLFAFSIESMEFLSLASLQVPSKASFAIGCLVGLVVSSVLFAIISSSVNAVIVLFAASPVDFEDNHPKLSEEMRTAWRNVWPGCLDVVDMRVPVGGYADPVNASTRASERHSLLA